MKYSKLFRKIARNKKGLDPDLTDSLIAILFSAMIFIFAFLFLANTNKGIEKSAVESIGNLEKDYILLNYLRTPIQENEITIAEYLGALSVEELKNECTKNPLLTTKTREILKDVRDWRVEVYTINKNGRESFCYIAKGAKTKTEKTEDSTGVLGFKSSELFDIIGETVKTVIPSNNPEFNIEIYLKIKD